MKYNRDSGVPPTSNRLASWAMVSSPARAAIRCSAKIEGGACNAGLMLIDLESGFISSLQRFTSVTLPVILGAGLSLSQHSSSFWVPPHNAVKDNPDWFQFFLSNPVAACQMVLDKWPGVKTGTYSQANQLRLMGIDGLNETE